MATDQKYNTASIDEKRNDAIIFARGLAKTLTDIADGLERQPLNDDALLVERILETVAFYDKFLVAEETSAGHAFTVCTRLDGAKRDTSGGAIDMLAKCYPMMTRECLAGVVDDWTLRGWEKVQTGAPKIGHRHWSHSVFGILATSDLTRASSAANMVKAMKKAGYIKPA